MQDPTEARLNYVRGAAPPKRHDARTIAALVSNPGCARRAVLDAAGIDKDQLARRVGFPPSFGQSPFAIARGNMFEAQVRAEECTELRRLLLEDLGIDLPEVAYADLGATDRDDDNLRARHARSRSRLLRALAATAGGLRRVEREGDDAGDDERGNASEGQASLFVHPLLRMSVSAQYVYLEPDLVAVERDGTVHVIEIKSFPVIDGQADGTKTAAAAFQAAVYVLALRQMLGPRQPVSHQVVLVCPKNFSNVPVATAVDVRRQLLVLEHQLARLAGIDTLLDPLPAELTLDLASDDGGTPTRPAAELVGALGHLPARYTPDCLSVCEMAFHCRDEAAGTTAALGVSVREQLGGVETVAEALGLADGTLSPTDDQVEAAALLRATATVYSAALDEGVA